MQDAPNGFDTPMVGLSKEAWLEKLAEIADEHGYFQKLGHHHVSTFVDEGKTLIVTFETIDGIQTLSDTAQPLGFDIVKATGWSHLGLISDGDTWFRDRHVYAYFDRLIDDGFFEDFDRVIFYGSGPCGYAAAAFSVAAPGAKVLAIQPQATLDPRVAGWDDRYRHMRRTSFTDRYGYAPDMLDAADRAYVVFDPMVKPDAMHAALFTRSNVTKLRVPNLGQAIESDLFEMQVLFRMIVQAGTGKLTHDSFRKMWRARRDYPPYLRNLMHRLDTSDRTYLLAALCRNVVARQDTAPRFQRRLDALEAQAAKGEITLPPPPAPRGDAG